MAMTPEQLSTYSADIASNTDPEVVQARNAGNANIIADWYNFEATPTTWFLRSSVQASIITAAMDWAGEYASIRDDVPSIQLLLMEGFYDPRAINSREALNAVFAGAPNSKSNILGISTRTGSHVEALFAETTSGPGGGNGSSQAQSAIAGFEGPVSVGDTITAMGMIP